MYLRKLFGTHKHAEGDDRYNRDGSGVKKLHDENGEAKGDDVSICI